MFLEKGSDTAALSAFHTVLEKAWCMESCSPSVRPQWESGSHAAGQCFVSALIVQDRFGGELFELPLPGGAVHTYNRINGKIVDLTSEQFAEEIDASFFARGIPADRAKRLQDATKAERYEILRQRVADILGE